MTQSQGYNCSYQWCLSISVPLDLKYRTSCVTSSKAISAVQMNSINEGYSFFYIVCQILHTQPVLSQKCVVPLHTKFSTQSLVLKYHILTLTIPQLTVYTYSCMSSHTQAHHHMCEVVWHQEIMHFRWNQVLVRIAEGGFVVPLILLCDSTALNDEKVIVEHLFQF